MEDNSLIVLGCSSATPNSLRFPSSQVLHFRGKYFLLDCGEGVQIQIRRAKVPFEKISAIFISHLHGDHFYGIFGLLSSMSLTGRKMALTIYCPQGLEDIIQYQFQTIQQPLSFPVQFVTLPKVPFACIEEKRTYKIYAIQLNHRVDCWGFYFVENKDERKIRKEAIEQYNLSIEEIKKIKQGADYQTKTGEIISNEELTNAPKNPFSYAYISDTLFKPEIANYIQNVQLMYHEATFRQDLIEFAVKTRHSTAQQAAECAKLAHAQKLIIGHYSARYKNLQGHLQDAQQVFENTELATDLYEYTLSKQAYCVWKQKEATE